MGSCFLVKYKLSLEQIGASSVFALTPFGLFDGLSAPLHLGTVPTLIVAVLFAAVLFPIAPTVGVLGIVDFHASIDK